MEITRPSTSSARNFNAFLIRNPLCQQPAVRIINISAVKSEKGPQGSSYVTTQAETRTINLPGTNWTEFGHTMRSFEAKFDVCVYNIEENKIFPLGVEFFRKSFQMNHRCEVSWKLNDMVVLSWGLCRPSNRSLKWGKYREKPHYLWKFYERTRVAWRNSAHVVALQNRRLRRWPWETFVTDASI